MSLSCTVSDIKFSELEALGQCIPPPRHVFTSVAIRIRIRIPNRLQNLIVCSLAHCQPSLKIACKSVRKFLRKVANRQTENKQRRLHILLGGGKYLSKSPFYLLVCHLYLAPSLRMTPSAFHPKIFGVRKTTRVLRLTRYVGDRPRCDQFSRFSTLSRDGQNCY